MRVPLDWVFEFVGCSLDAAEVSDKLTMMGLEVEEVEATGASGAAVLNIKPMSNRGDCLSMIGVARELAADLDVPVKFPELKLAATGQPVPERATVSIEAPELCFRYAATLVTGIKVGPSPKWMADRLLAAGMRPINNIVDVTNYLMLQHGQPLHAFDYDLLAGQSIVVRTPKPGEKLKTLDGVQRELSPEMLLICDAKEPVAIAGVMGGSDSEVTEKTTNVLIESACFNGSSVRATARKLGMATEASYRFERGVDVGQTADIALRAAALIAEVAGGEIAEGVVDAITRQPETRQITLRPARIRTILGIEVSASESADFMRRISLQTAMDESGSVIVTVPSYRPDLQEEIDLIEEVGRVYGFDNLPVTLIEGPSLQGKDSARGEFESRLRRVLQVAGMKEAVTHSIVPRNTARAESKEPVVLRNALSDDVAEMRTSLIPGLTQALGHNYSRDIRDLALFEIGRVFSRGKDAPDESTRIAGVITGTVFSDPWVKPEKKLTADAFRRAIAADFYVAKGFVESLLKHLHLNAKFTKDADILWRTGYSASVDVRGTRIGWLGEISPELADRFHLRSPAFGFELDVALLEELEDPSRRWQEPSRYPSVRRDLAIVVHQNTAFSEILEAIMSVGEGAIENAKLLDIFEGEQVGAGKKSVALSIILRSREKTFAEDEISGIISAIREALMNKVGAEFRDA